MIEPAPLASQLAPDVKLVNHSDGGAAGGGGDGGGGDSNDGDGTAAAAAARRVQTLEQRLSEMRDAAEVAQPPADAAPLPRLFGRVAVPVRFRLDDE